MKNQALQVRLWVRANQDKFVEFVDVLDEDGDVVLHPSTKEAITKQRVKVCGSASVME